MSSMDALEADLMAAGVLDTVIVSRAGRVMIRAASDQSKVIGDVERRCFRLPGGYALSVIRNADGLFEIAFLNADRKVIKPPFWWVDENEKYGFQDVVCGGLGAADVIAYTRRFNAAIREGGDDHAV